VIAPDSWASNMVEPFQLFPKMKRGRASVEAPAGPNHFSELTRSWLSKFLCPLTRNFKILLASDFLDSSLSAMPDAHKSKASLWNCLSMRKRIHC